MHCVTIMIKVHNWKCTYIWHLPFSTHTSPDWLCDCLIQKSILEHTGKNLKIPIMHLKKLICTKLILIIRYFLVLPASFLNKLYLSLHDNDNSFPLLYFFSVEKLNVKLSFHLLKYWLLCCVTCHILWIEKQKSFLATKLSYKHYR